MAVDEITNQTINIESDILATRDEPDELQIALDKEILNELKEATDVVTKHTIHLRVYKKVANLLNLNMDFGIDPKSVHIHPDNIQRIDQKWKKHVESNCQISHDELNAYDKVKSSDYVNTLDINKFIGVLVRKDTVERDPNDKEKILNSKDLNILLGVDGFLGYTPGDMKNYIENLKFGSNVHVETIREMYDLDSLKSLSGTDATCVVFLALMSIYKTHISDDQSRLIIDNMEADTKTYLSRNAKYYDDITSAVENINDLVTFYKSKVADSEIARISIVKVTDLITKSKKRKLPNAPSKRGRKKIKVATESDKDITKQKKRSVKILKD